MQGKLFKILQKGNTSAPNSPDFIKRTLVEFSHKRKQWRNSDRHLPSLYSVDAHWGEPADLLSKAMLFRVPSQSLWSWHLVHMFFLQLLISWFCFCTSCLGSFVNNHINLWKLCKPESFSASQDPWRGDIEGKKKERKIEISSRGKGEMNSSVLNMAFHG